MHSTRTILDTAAALKGGPGAEFDTAAASSAAAERGAAGGAEVAPDATARAAGGLKLCLFGAAPDTGNLGVSALCFATLAGLARVDPSVHVTVFDYTPGVRRDTTILAGKAFDFVRCGISETRLIYRRESLWNIRWSARLGGLASSRARALLAADAVLDISGGDSFADLYGEGVFRHVVKPKLLALELGRPLILLPQTYGPFKDAKLRQMASGIVRRANMAWARDEHSFNALRELVGEGFDPKRHRCGVDVAFGLELGSRTQHCCRGLRVVTERDRPLSAYLRGLSTEQRSGRHRTRAKRNNHPACRLNSEPVKVPISPRDRFVPLRS